MPNTSTYGVKYDVEHAFNIYVSEGSLLRAALLAGFELKPVTRGETYRINLHSDDLHSRLIEVIRNAVRRLRDQPQGLVQVSA